MNQMNTVTIKTNYHWHNFLQGYELPENQREEFHWLNGSQFDEQTFIKYKGQYYALNEFMTIEHAGDVFKGWHGYLSDSYFSGVLLRVSDDGEQYQIATYYS